MQTRRSFLAASLVGAAGALGRPVEAQARTIETVRGPIPAAELGVTLMHEHVLVDFGPRGPVPL